MRFSIDDEMRLPLLITVITFFGLVILFSFVEIEDQRKHLSSEKAMSRMCSIKESYYSGWMGNVISRQAVARVWDLIVYEEGKGLLAKSKEKDELLKSVNVTADGRMLSFDFGPASNGRSADSLARGLVDEIKQMSRSPSSSGSIKCFYELSFDLFNEVQVTTPRGSARLGL